MNKDVMTKKALSRRDFLIYLGAGTSLAIAGFFTFDTLKTTAKAQPDDFSVNPPKLSATVKKESENDQMVLSGEHVKCMVNETGEKIIELLDGNHTLPRIAAKISDYYSIEHTDALEVSVASFLCQLGSLGFLSAPFYVTMYETY